MFSKLAFKFFFVFLGVILVAIGFSQWLYSREFAEQLEQNALESGITRVEAFGANLERSLDELIPEKTSNLAQACVDKSVKNGLINTTAGVAVSSGILFASVHGLKGEVLAETGRLDLIEDSAWSVKLEQNPDKLFLMRRVDEQKSLKILDLTSPLMYRHEESLNADAFLYGNEAYGKVAHAYGFVRLGLDISPVEAKIRQNSRRILGIAVALSLLSALLILFLVNRIVEPLIRLREATRIVASGNLDYHVQTESTDEIGELARSFDEMTATLKQTRQELALQATFLQNEGDIAIATDMEGKIIYVNTAAVNAYGADPGELLGRFFAHFIAEKDRARAEETVAQTLEKGKFEGELLSINKDGVGFPLDLTGVLLRNEYDQPIAIILVGRDVSEKHRLQQELVTYTENLEKMIAERTREIQVAYDTLKQTQFQLLQSEKLASIGQLAAGVAHEINNPVGFVQSNLDTLADYVGTFKNLLASYEQLSTALKSGKSMKDKEIQEILSGIEEIRQNQNLSFILEDIDSLLSESTEGTRRVGEIVWSLKSFARVDESELKETDINQGLEETLKIVWNELKYKTRVHKKFQSLPLIKCYPKQLNQVFLNLLMNAVQAIPEQGEITIETGVTDTHIFIRISDTGVGIPPDKLPKIFDPFFTTKPMSEGRGLGLAISYGIIKKHNGTLDVESEPGRGTTFTIRLPVAGVEHE